MAIVPSMQLAPIGTTRNYRARIASRSIGALHLLAHATTDSRMETDDSSGWHLIFHCTGQATLHCDGKDHVLQPGSNALILPNMRRQSHRSTSSAVSVVFDRQRLEATLATMAGDAEQRITLEQRPLQLDLLRHEGLFASFLQTCGLLDATPQESPALAEALGLDDLIYRWIAVAMGAADGPDGPNRRKAPRNSALDIVCDMIRASRERPMTLTEMEAASGLSARALQYAFKARFDCSPMQWQRRERLLQARELLLRYGDELSVTTLAHALGFSSSAAFATVYKRQFGETPTQTRGGLGDSQAALS